MDDDLFTDLFGDLLVHGGLRVEAVASRRRTPSPTRPTCEVAHVGPTVHDTCPPVADLTPEPWVIVEEPRRWWQKRRHRVACTRCGWRSEPVAVDRSGVGNLQLTVAAIDHRVTTLYRCMEEPDRG